MCGEENTAAVDGGVWRSLIFFLFGCVPNVYFSKTIFRSERERENETEGGGNT